MTGKYMMFFLAVSWVLFNAASLHADPIAFTFDTLPGSQISGPAGSTIGWGYVIGNPSASLWLSLIDISADVFQHATVDFSIFDLPILAPGETRSVSFDPQNFSGLLSLTWDADAPSGFVNRGTFILSGEWFDQDPFLGGVSIDTASAKAAYSAVVSGGESAPVPEPATWVLLGTGLAALCLKRTRAVSNLPK